MRTRGGGGVRGRGALAPNPLLPRGRSQAGLQTNKQTNDVRKRRWRPVARK